MAPHSDQGPVLGAIDVGTNASRLKLARADAHGRLHGLYQRRDPIRPGEGVFRTGWLAEGVVERLVVTLQEYRGIADHHNARLRAVATSSLRDARNGEAVQRRVRERTGVALEILSGVEEARLICRGVLHGASPQRRSLVLDIGGGSSEVTLARGEHPVSLWSLPVGTVRLTERYAGQGRVPPARLDQMRREAREVSAGCLEGVEADGLDGVYGSSGTIRSLAAFIGPKKKSRTVRAASLAEAVERLAAMDVEERRRHFEPRRADVIVAGAVVLEALMTRLALPQVKAVDKGLRDGVLQDLLHPVPRQESAP